MNNMLVRAGIVGGLIVFLWGIFSWMILPWHSMTMEKFVDEQYVARVIQENAPESGIYVLPCMYASSRDSMKNEMQMNQKMSKRGPFVFASVNLDARAPLSASNFIVGLLTQIVAALFITWMLLQTKAMHYMQRVWFVAAVGLVAGILAYVPAWNWMDFPPSYTIVNLLDITIAWFLAGLGIGKVLEVKRKKR